MTNVSDTCPFKLINHTMKHTLHDAVTEDELSRACTVLSKKCEGAFHLDEHEVGSE